MRSFGMNTKILWNDRKRWCGMPLSFTRYYLVEQQGGWMKLFTSIGLLSTAEEEVNLFRIFDISVYQSLVDKMFGVGTITLHCNDESHSKIYLTKIKNPFQIRNMLAELIESERAKKGYRLGEFYS